MDPVLLPKTMRPARDGMCSVFGNGFLPALNVGLIVRSGDLALAVEIVQNLAAPVSSL